MEYGLDGCYVDDTFSCGDYIGLDGSFYIGLDGSFVGSIDPSSLVGITLIGVEFMVHYMW